MRRTPCLFRLAVFALLALLAAAPTAEAHDGAGIVHFLSQPDHVLGLVAAVAVAVVFWFVVRTKKRTD